MQSDMATPVMDEIESFEILVCQVCLENMVDREPRTLTCNHSFCSSCLSQLVCDGKIECPTCRKDSVLPSGDHLSLPINFNLIKIQEREKDLILNRNLVCQNCLLKNSQSRATHKCTECFRVLCGNCKERHDDIPAFEEHTVELLQGRTGKQSITCKRHSQVGSYLCLECHQALCLDCVFSKDHEDHKTLVKTMKSGINQEKKRIRKDIEKIANKTESLKEKNVQTKEILDEINSLKERIETHLENQFSLIAKAETLGADLNEMERSTDEAFIYLLFEKSHSIMPLLQEIDNAIPSNNTSAAWKTEYQVKMEAECKKEKNDLQKEICHLRDRLREKNENQAREKATYQERIAGLKDEIEQLKIRPNEHIHSTRPGNYEKIRPQGYSPTWTEPSDFDLQLIFPSSGYVRPSRRRAPSFTPAQALEVNIPEPATIRDRPPNMPHGSTINKAGRTIVYTPTELKMINRTWNEKPPEYVVQKLQKLNIFNQGD